MSTKSAAYIHLPHLGHDLVRDIPSAVARFGSFGQQEGGAVIESGFGCGLRQREDAIRHLVRSGGRIGRGPELSRPEARTRIYGAVLSRGDAPGPFDGLVGHESFAECAAALFGRPLVQPFILVANIMLPGQILALHTDVGQFRGVDRFNSPQWLLVAMQFSGLFEPWRIPIATATSYFGGSHGGEFVCYPEGVSRPPVVIAASPGSAVVTDVDAVVHGVALVGDAGTPPPPHRPAAKLRWDGSRFALTDPSGGMHERFRWEDIRLSISWKAFCLADEADRRRMVERTDDISPEWAVARLTSDLIARGVLRGAVPEQTELARLIIEHYIAFPPDAGWAQP